MEDEDGDRLRRERVPRREVPTEEQVLGIGVEARRGPVEHKDQWLDLSSPAQQRAAATDRARSPCRRSRERAARSHEVLKLPVADPPWTMRSRQPTLATAWNASAAELHRNNGTAEVSTSGYYEWRTRRAAGPKL